MAVTGCKSRALSYLREALAAQEAFQEWTDTENATAALTRIAEHSSEEADLPDRPWALIRFAGPQQRKQVALNTFAPPATVLQVIAEADVSEANQNNSVEANYEASDAWDAFRAMLADCDGREVSGVRLYVPSVDEIMDEEEVGAILWPAEDEREAGSVEWPYWTARALVTVGGAIED